MIITVHVHHHFDPIGEPGAAGVQTILAAIQELSMSLQDKIDTLVREVSETATVNDSVLALVQGLRAQLDAVVAGEATIDQVIAGLDAEQARLADAVTANTPAAPVV